MDRGTCKRITIAAPVNRRQLLNSEQTPIHPLRLCKEIRDFLDRDAILCVDGNEILHFGRQSLPTYVPGHRLNSGVTGTMGVGLPYGIGAQVAKPDTQVLVLHGDGSMGMNAMEIGHLRPLQPAGSYGHQQQRRLDGAHSRQAQAGTRAWLHEL